MNDLIFKKADAAELAESILLSLATEPNTWDGHRRRLAHVSGIEVYCNESPILNRITVRLGSDTATLPYWKGIKIALAMRPIGIMGERATAQKQAAKLILALRGPKPGRN